MIRLLFDENLSESLVPLLKDLFPNSLHVRLLGAGGATDSQVWALAQEHGALLVSRDEDFRAMSILVGPPPKVVWLNVGNPSTAQVAALLRVSHPSLARLIASEEESFLVLTLATPAR
jgi:predicted nuclease of predicted toxin-antitoxin system